MTCVRSSTRMPCNGASRGEFVLFILHLAQRSAWEHSATCRKSTLPRFPLRLALLLKRGNTFLGIFRQQYAVGHVARQIAATLVWNLLPSTAGLLDRVNRERRVLENL